MQKTVEKTEPKLQELKTRLTEIRDIEAATSVLDWDQATYIPHSALQFVA